MKRFIIILVGIVFATSFALGVFLVNELKSPLPEETHLYIDADDNVDSVIQKLRAPWLLRKMLSTNRYKVRTGYYHIESDEPMLQVFRCLRNGSQTPIRLTIPSVRTLPQLSSVLGKKLMMDSTAVADLLSAKEVHERYGKNPNTMVTLFLPDTYECFWNITPEALLQRMEKESKVFWNEERMGKAKSLGLTPEEVVTLASIVDEETNYAPEKARVAGLYLNRLRMGMLLQADPTVKFAVGDFALRRILHQHLTVDNPYNTYRYKGLPPGPIRIATKAAIDAVLNAEKHKYIYMCAKEDFSGAHNFAANYSEHQKNARRYAAELNRRGIK